MTSSTVRADNNDDLQLSMIYHVVSRAQNFAPDLILFQASVRIYPFAFD